MKKGVFKNVVIKVKNGVFVYKNKTQFKRVFCFLRTATKQAVPFSE